MKILFLTTHFNSGGITSYICMLTKGLIAQGHEVFVASSGGHLTSDLQKANVKHIQLDIQTKSELSPKIYLALPETIKVIKENNIDIIHSQTRITQVMGVFLKKLTEKCFVTTCHGFYKAHLARRMFPCWGDQVVAISPAVFEHLEHDFHVKHQNIHLIQHGIYIEDFPPTNKELKEKKRLNYKLNDRPIVGIIARLADVKGHDVLIKSIDQVKKRFPNVLLMIVGTGKMEQKLRELVSELKLESNVQFYPVVNKTSEVLPIFDVSVLSSIDEGLGISIMEAQASAIPFVATRVGGVPSIITHEKNGLLVNPNDSGDLAKAIIRLLEDRELAQSLAKAGRENIIENFSSDQMIEKTINMYKRAINNGQ